MPSVISFQPICYPTLFRPSVARYNLLCLLLTSVYRSNQIALISVHSLNNIQISRGKTLSFYCVDAGFIKRTPMQMEGLLVTCPMASNTSHLISSSCSSSHNFGLDFLQTPPHDDALVLFLAFGSANTWQEDLHLSSSVPCPAHTPSSAAI